MNRIDLRFSELRAAGRAALVVRVTAGDPDAETCSRILAEVSRSGADVIDLRLPFSDPAADGPAVRLAARRALASGMTVRKAIALVARFREGHSTPVLLSSYANPVFRHGCAAFARDASSAGADGLFAADVPPEESAALEEALSGSGMLLVREVAPSTVPRRLPVVARGAGGFFPVVVPPGFAPGGLEALASSLRRGLGLPLCLEGAAAGGVLFRRAIGLFDGFVEGDAPAELAETLRGDGLVASVGKRVAELRGLV